MSEKNKKLLLITIILFLIFFAFTAMVLVVDRQPIGVENTMVGLATFNKRALEILGSSEICYKVSEYFGVAAFGFCAIFGSMGIIQWIKRKNIFKVDARIIILGIFYFLMLGLYIVFDKIPINYRPVILDGQLEQSYPSSHTMMSVCICITSAINFEYYFVDDFHDALAIIGCSFISLVIIAGRLLSGMHWASDIIGAVLLANALSMLYYFVVNLVEKND